MFDLSSHGADTFVGSGPRYPWGGLYGGQIVAQALEAAARSVDDTFLPHSIRAYFIRPGDHTEPVRYEVDRIRNGRSFVTRRVVARQAIGAILNAECSFQAPEHVAAVQTIESPQVAPPEGYTNTSFSRHFDRRFVPIEEVAGGGATIGAGRTVAWMRVLDEVPDRSPDGSSVLHECWLAYISDDLATDTVKATLTSSHPDWKREEIMSVSLDHTIWFHRRLRADTWHIHDFSTLHVHGGRGLAFGYVFTPEGEHVASVAQEVLVRDRRARR